MKLILKNSLWLITDKLLKLCVGVFVSVWIVRYLGPEWFGKFNFVNALIVLFGTLISFGSEGILVRMLVSEPEKHDEILLASFWIHLVFAFISLIFSIISIGILRSEDNLYFLLFLLSIPSLFRCFSVVRYAFEAKLEVKYVVWIENLIFIIVSGLRILIIANGFSYLVLFSTFAIEGILTSLSIYFFYVRSENLFVFKFPNKFRVRKILIDSFPLFIAGLAIIIYMKIDQIMIGSMLGDAELGIYSVGVRWSEFWYFIPIGLSSSFFPELIRLKNHNSPDFERRFVLLHGIVFWIAIFAALGVQLFSETLILYLYGDLFHLSASILKIHIWSGVFVFLGVAGGNFFLIENLQKYAISKSLFGLLVNIVLNYIWIPVYGIKGAAFATLVSQFCASTLFLVFIKQLRPLLKFQLSVFFVWKFKLSSLSSLSETK